MAKLNYKLEITGTIEVVTGLHIGGSDVDLNIGGIDSEVAKNKQNGKPYIPGSSLSGKLRSLIAKAKGYKYLNYNAAKENHDLPSKNWDRSYLALLFNGNGFNADFGTQKPYDYSNNDTTFNGVNITLAPHTRLLIRDDFMLNPDALLDKVLEDKAENVINRNTGEANPRHIERVVTGTKFQLKMVLDVYQYDDVIKLCETLHLGINLLNNDYLGGMGSRGSGEVKILIDKVEKMEFVGGTINRTEFTDYSFNN
jgi:CRISPR-associated protein Csm3